MIDVTIIFLLIILIFSIIIHELSHGYVAYSLGDPTAKYSGRLTLNPIPHIDPIGSILVPILLIILPIGFIFGWAKPVPVNPYNFRDQKWGSVKVSVAGPASNIFLALFFGLLLRFIPYNFFIAIPGFIIVLQWIVFINLALAFFNLLPIPPLDGHWILFHFIPRRLENIKFFFRQYGFFILIFLIFFAGIGRWLFALVIFLHVFITGSFPAELFEHIFN
jgi:Zn-dependent protease